MNSKFVEWLGANGYDAEALNKPENAKQRTHLEAAWKAETSPPTVAVKSNDEGDSFASKMAAIEAEASRVSEIQSLAATEAATHTHNPDKIKQIRELCDAAVGDQTTSVKDFKLSLIRMSRMVGPLIYAPEKPQANSDVIEAAICRMGRLDGIDKHFDARTLDHSHKMFRHGVGLHELIGIGAQQAGWRGQSVGRDMKNALKYAFRGGEMEAMSGPSTISVPGILSNIANKFLAQSWNSVESSWREITAIRSVKDFKTVTSYSLTGDLQYDKVAPGGKLKHGTLGEETYTNRADTYGKVMGLDRRDLINDDLGAFLSMQTRLGRGGALKLNDVFWTEFLADASTFWTANRGNYDDGTDTAFGFDGLTAAMVIWRAKTDPDSKPQGIPARILLVPPQHEFPAIRLMSSQQLMKDSVDGDSNPFVGKFRVVVSEYLANSAYTGYSTKAWYLLCSPADLPVIEVAFLNGVEMPTVEEVELSADQLGMAMRAYHDFGVNKQEYRGGLKLKGEA